jgi:uncharacterized Zn finger protein
VNIIKDATDTYRVESHEKGVFYTVNARKRTCTCPQFRYRGRKAPCKHLVTVLERTAGGEEVIEYVRDHVFVDAVELLEKFKADTVESLKRRGELIEEHGKIRLL